MNKYDDKENCKRSNSLIPKNTMIESKSNNEKQD